MNNIKTPCVVYDPAMAYDGGRGGLRIDIPGENGIVNYNFVHTVVEEKNTDIWRLSVANQVDQEGNILRQLTKDRAEWDMAIRLADRPDFIGGYNHGDERGTALSLQIDGREIAPEALTERTAFSELKIKVCSVGYDPKSQSDAVLEHEKDFYFTQEGVLLHQQIRWLTDCSLDLRLKSYLAMMPPLKHDPEDPEKIITDTFYTDKNPASSIEKLPFLPGKASKICVFGSKSRVSFSMEAEHYAPLYRNSYQAILTDNGGCNYNKMYIAFAGGAPEQVTAGTVWKATTRYKIEFI